MILFLGSSTMISTGCWSNVEKILVVLSIFVAMMLFIEIMPLLSRQKIEHTCIGMAPPSRLPAASLSWLLRKVPKFFEVSRTTSTCSIVDAIRIHHWQHIHIWQALRVKAVLLRDSLSQHRK